MAFLIVCWAISLLILIGGFALGIRCKNGRSKVIVSTAGVGGAVFAFRFFALFQPLQGDLSARISSFFLIVGRSIVHTLQTFSLDEDYDFFMSVLQEKCQPGVLLDVLSVYCMVLNVLAPIMTAAVILTLLEELISRIRAYMRPSKETFIFSELNERALVLAEDIRKNKRHAFLLFTNLTEEKSEEQVAKLRDRARKIGAVCVKNDITTMHIRHHSRVPITFVLADMNEHENLRVAAWLSAGNKKLNKYILANVLVFCTSGEAEVTVQEAITNRANPNMRFFAVNDCVYPIHQLLTDHPLFARMEPGEGPNEKAQCTVLIVGCGYVGMECVKSIAWCGQMANTNLKIHVVSNDAEEKGSALMKDCPELFTTGLYDITFKSIDVSGNEFIHHLKETVPDACYVVVALGSEQRNITVSQELKRFYDRLSLQGGKAPQICYLVMDDSLFSTFNRQKYDEVPENECLLIPFGNNKKRFSMESIFSSDLERMALSIHLTYWRMPVDIQKLSYQDEKTADRKEGLPEIKKSFLRGESFNLAAENDPFVLGKRYILFLFNRCFPRCRAVLWLYCSALSRLRKKPAAAELRKQLSEREGAINAYYNSIYSQNSSRSSAVHLHYNIYAAVGNATGKIAEDTLKRYDDFIKNEKNCVEIAKLEHLRWDAYMRSIGYILPAEEEFDTYAYTNGNSHQQKRLLLHPCLVDWDERLDKVLVPEDYELYERQDPAFMYGRFLSELDDLDRVSLKVWLTRKQRKGKTEFIDYKTTDEVIIQNTSAILRDATSNEEIV